ncbi:MAG TPA: aldehyde dehydrogenase family protein [Acidisoma sp.]|nr:aldehyde dehydrogenase family protein [Acidisoma sp.]
MHLIKGLRVLDSPDGLVVGRMRPGESWDEGDGRLFLEIISPATGARVGAVPLGTADDAARAVEAAVRAKRFMSKLSIWERAKLCLAVADRIEARADELARLLTLEQGKPFHAEAKGEIVGAVTAFRDAAEQIKWLETAAFPLADGHKRAYSFLQPKGVFGVITPWNFPAAQPCVYYLAPGLATGNAMVWVPAPTTSLIAAMLMECFVEAGVPDGAINLVTGEGPVVGDAVVTHPGVDAIAFTGSSETGAIIAARGAGKPLMLELGGNGPTLVLADADVEMAAARIATGCFTNAGQICTATERVLVHDSVYDRFSEEMVKAAAAVRMGDPFDPATTMGPLNNEPTAAKMDEHLDDARERQASIAFGGARMQGMPTQLHYQPTVVTNLSPDARLNVQETFGPVAPLLRFRDEDEAWSIIGRSRFGLSAAVFTNTIKDAFRWAESLRVGIVNINEMSPFWETHIPAGGAAGTASGIGRTGGRHTLLEMSDLKTITIDISR